MRVKRHPHILSSVFGGLLFLLLSTASDTHARGPFDFDLPEMPVIKGAEWSWVGRKMLVNGVPTSIKTFRYQGSADEVRRYYRKYWSGRGTGQVTESRLALEHSLGFEWREHYFTVQFYENGGVIDGKLVVTTSNFKDHLKPVTTQLPLLPGNRVKSRVDSIDNGRITESTIIRSKRSVSMNLDYMQRELERDGWQAVLSSADFNKKKSFNEARKIIMQKSSQLIHAIAYPPFAKARDCEITVHWTK